MSQDSGALTGLATKLSKDWEAETGSVDADARQSLKDAFANASAPLRFCEG
jgi:hypothetical protein